jgi:hypothetical protein
MPFKEYPQGRDSGALWAPWKKAKEAVELYPSPPQEPGMEVGLIRHDAEAGILELRLPGLKLPSACPRFASRACPRMEPMGHEPSQASCNYWDYPRMQELAPGVELYPEWQRFDCHKYYPLFQAWLCGSELAGSLGCRLKVVLPDADPKLLRVFASLCSDPEAFSNGDS